MKFKLKNTDQKARRGTLTFERGAVETPAFMPVGTYGTVKAMTPEEVEEIGAQIIIGNTFHLAITPGTDVIKAHGDLHDFMHWQGPILTDSGGLMCIFGALCPTQRQLHRLVCGGFVGWIWGAFIKNHHNICT
jgi:tRNA-guanine family transglycosylase